VTNPLPGAKSVPILYDLMAYLYLLSSKPASVLLERSYKGRKLVRNQPGMCLPFWDVASFSATGNQPGLPVPTTGTIKLSHVEGFTNEATWSVTRKLISALLCH